MQVEGALQGGSTRPRRGRLDLNLRRTIVLLTVAAMVAVMMVASTAPAFALPPSPIHGQQVSAVAKLFPTDPTHPATGPYQGERVSLVAKGSPTCGPLICE